MRIAHNQYGILKESLVSAMRKLFTHVLLMMTALYAFSGHSAECKKDAKYGAQTVTDSVKFSLIRARGCYEFSYLDGLAARSEHHMKEDGACVAGQPEFQFYFVDHVRVKNLPDLVNARCTLILGPHSVIMDQSSCADFAHAFRDLNDNPNSPADLEMKIHSSPPVVLGDQTIEIKHLTEFCLE